MSGSNFEWDKANRTGAAVTFTSFVLPLSTVALVGATIGNDKAPPYTNDTVRDAAIVQPASKISGAFTALEKEGVTFSKVQQDVREGVEDRLGRMHNYDKTEVQSVIFESRLEGAKEAGAGLWSPEALTDAGSRLLEIDRGLKDITETTHARMMSQGMSEDDATRISAGLVAVEFQDQRNAPTAKDFIREAKVGFDTQLDLLNASAAVKGKIEDLHNTVNFPNWGLDHEGVTVVQYDMQGSGEFQFDNEGQILASEMQPIQGMERKPVNAEMRPRHEVGVEGSEATAVEVGDRRQAVDAKASDQISMGGINGAALEDERAGITLEDERIAATVKGDRIVASRDDEKKAVTLEDDRIAVSRGDEEKSILLDDNRIEISKEDKRIPITLSSERMGRAERVTAAVQAKLAVHQGVAVETSPEDQNRLDRIRQKAQEMAARPGVGKTKGHNQER